MTISVRRHARAIGMLAARSMFAASGAVSATARDARAPDDQAYEFVLKYQKPL